MKRNLTLVPDEADACMTAALKTLRSRWQGEAELASKLVEKGYSSDVTAGVIEKLRGDGWIDDARFSETHARARVRRGFGSERILRELHGLGVARETAAAAVAAVFPEDAERESLVESCRKKMRMMAARHGSSYVLEDDGRKKLTGYLLTRGYDYGEISAVIQHELKTIQKDQA